MRLPRPLLDAVRWLRHALPAPAGDLAADLRDLLRPRSRRLPPAGLRQKVGLTATRAEYEGAGAVAAEEVLGAVAGLLPSSPGRWLDFGCGCGRLARHLLAAPACAELTGLDIDLDSVRWCERHLRGRFAAIGSDPPTPLPSGRFALVLAASVFTHLDEEPQKRWLAELGRLLSPGGILVASTHGPALLAGRDDLPEGAAARFAERGFLFLPPRGHFNTGTTYHARSYLEGVWGGGLRLERFVERGLFRLQDLSVWRREGA